MPDIPNNADLANALLQIADISKQEYARHAVQDERNDQLQASMNKLTENMAELVTEVRVIAVSNEHIEKRILKEVDSIRDSQSKLVCRVDEHAIQIKTIETNNAYQAGLDKGEDNTKKFWLDVRFKTAGVVLTMVALSVTLYKFFTGSGSGG